MRKAKVLTTVYMGPYLRGKCHGDVQTVEKHWSVIRNDSYFLAVELSLKKAISVMGIGS